MKLKKRWITSVLKEAEATNVTMPWTRGSRRKPIEKTESVSSRKPQGVLRA